MKFPNMAKLCANYREAAQISQQQLAVFLGFKNGQFISNVERGICTIPLRKMKVFCGVLKIEKQMAISSIIADNLLKIDRALK
jgi:transcriptional regulator with XRE-family HTH domain